MPVQLAGAPASVQAQDDWLAGAPMDPVAATAEPLPSVPGFPYLHPGAGAVIVGPTGSGRSSLMEAGVYDASGAGVRCAYLGSEITESEFNARAAILAGLRGDTIDDELRSRLTVVRYLDLASVLMRAWIAPEAWVTGMTDAYDVVILDPISAIASALDLDFDRSNSDFVKFYDKLVQPLTTRGLAVVMPDNVGHAIEAKGRAKGASAKSDRADLTFSCALATSPIGLVIRAQKVRTVRAGFQRGDEWMFDRDTQQIERHAREDHAVGAENVFRPTVLMERVSRLLSDEPGLGKSAIRSRITGRNNYIDDAIQALVREGYIERRPSGQAHQHHPIRPFIADSEHEPCPDRAPTSLPTVPTLPQSVPHRAHEPADDRAHRAIRAEHYGHGDGIGHGHGLNPDAELGRIVEKFGQS